MSWLPERVRTQTASAGLSPIEHRYAARVGLHRDPGEAGPFV